MPKKSTHQDRNVFHVKTPGLLIDQIASQCALSKKKSKELLDLKRISVNGRKVWIAKYKLQPNDRVEVNGLNRTTHSTFPELYKDETCLIINKPAGLVSDGKNSCESILRKKYGPQIRAIHRLDRETSGCLMFSTSPEHRENWVGLFTTHNITKVYLAIVAGRIHTKHQTIQTPIRDQHAQTRVDVIRSHKTLSYVRVHILTGRTHQIRIHLESIGHPVFGDTTYKGKEQPIVKISPARPYLHAETLNFQHPLTASPIHVHAPLTPDFNQALSQYGLRKTKST